MSERAAGAQPPACRCSLLFSSRAAAALLSPFCLSPGPAPAMIEPTRQRLAIAMGVPGRPGISESWLRRVLHTCDILCLE